MTKRLAAAVTRIRAACRRAARVLAQHLAYFVMVSGVLVIAACQTTGIPVVQSARHTGGQLSLVPPTPEDEELVAWGMKTAAPWHASQGAVALATGVDSVRHRRDDVEFTAPVSARAERMIAAYARAMQAFTRRTGREIMAAIDNQTGEQVGPVEEGLWWGVGGMWITLALQGRRDVTELHTHPADASFSPTDIEFFLAYPQIRRDLVLVPGGTLYLLERPLGRHRAGAATGAWPVALYDKEEAAVADWLHLVGPEINTAYRYPNRWASRHAVTARFAAALGYRYRRVPAGEAIRGKAE